MPRITTLEKFKEQLFGDFDDLELSAREKDQITRFRFILTTRLDTPSISNKSLVSLMVKLFGISATQAYRDIGSSESAFGSVINAEKEWLRYLALETVKEAIELAKEKGDYKEMIKGAAAIANIGNLDKVDAEKIPYDEIIPLPIEFANEPKLLGIETIINPRELVEKAKKKFIDIEHTVIDE